MRAYILRRLLISIPLVFLMTFVIFAVINTDPQSALDRFILNPNISFQVIEQVKERTGFYDAMPVRYVKWLSGVLFDIRFGRQRRALVSFADARQFPEQFAVDTSRSLTDGSRELTAEQPAWNLADLPGGTAPGHEGASSVASYVVEVEAPAGADPASQIALSLRTSAGGTLERVVPLPAAVAAGLRVTAQELKDAGIWKQPLDQFEVRLIGAGPVTVKKVSAVLDLFSIVRPERRRPYLAMAFPVAGASLTLGNPGSPHLTHRLMKTDWNPKGKPVGATEDGTPVGSTESFRSLLFEVGNPADRAASYEMRLVSGPPEHSRVTARTFTLKPGERTRLEFLLTELARDGAVLDQVREIQWTVDESSRLFVYRVELVLEGPRVTVGWIPDFGRSHDNIPVIEKLAGRIKNTVLLVIFAMLITWAVALPAGVLAAVRQYGLSDKLLSFLTFIGMSLPSFFLAVLVRYLLQEAADPNSALGFLPTLPDSGRTSIHFDSLTRWGQTVDLIRHAVAPTLVLALGGMAGMQRVMRGTMLEAQRQQYITTARAKGLSERVVIYKHALRNAITPFVAGFGSILPGLIGGSLFIEMVFNYPGVGQMMYPAVLNRDLNLVMANTLIAALLLVVGNLISDILLALVDPRVSYA
jgi:peptide/nickel transport system permease protein